MVTYFGFLLATAALGLIPRGGRAREIGYWLLGALFIGMRFEVGFDWPFYKGQFQAYASGASPFALSVGEGALYEPAYALLSWLFAQVVPAYEVFQFLLTLFWLHALLAWLRSVEAGQWTLAVVVVHGFLLFTLEFSTLRQCIATSCVLLGIAAWLQGERRRSLLWLVLGPLFQMSSLAYVAAFAFARAVRVRKTGSLLLSIVLVAGGAGILLGGAEILRSTLGDAATVLPGTLGVKARYYLVEREYGVNPLEQIFAIVLYVGTFLVGLSVTLGSARGNGGTAPAVPRPRPGSAERSRVLGILLMTLAATAMLFLPIHTVRNRILYLTVPILAGIVFSDLPVPRIRRLARLGVVGAALVFYSAQFARPIRYVYTPYQSVAHEWLGYPTDGPERQARMWAEISRRR